VLIVWALAHKRLLSLVPWLVRYSTMVLESKVHCRWLGTHM
jgi:hypothetical protein